MVFVTVFRHVPRPIAGMIGVVYDRTYDIQRETVRARQLGIGDDTVRLAKESGARPRHVDVPAA